MSIQPERFAAMPPLAPLEMRAQTLRTAPSKVFNNGTSSENTARWRAAVFLPALIGTALLVHALYAWLANTGMTGLEWGLLGLIALTFVWATLSVSTVGVAVAGLVARSASRDTWVLPPPPMDVALLIPIYNENVSAVFGNASAMVDDLARNKGVHRYSLFVLSDTQDPSVAEEEERAFAVLSAKRHLGISLHYRRRSENTDKKVGNLLDWITNWGGAYEAMLVLDADSLMTGEAIKRLSDELSSDPAAGLIQSCPMLVDANTLFARAQQFSNVAYGWLLAEGLAIWARGEGNYWGHNAIIRTRAFAASAGLPRLKDRKGQDQLILSHDFVEAGLLRRAGWRVRFLPRLTGSFEETPATLIDYTLRDERWCRGNLQHLRLLATKGLHPISRFHLLHGSVSYLLSPAWFVLLVIWFLLGKDSETNIVRYFNETNPLFPDWPPAMSHIDSAVFLMIMYAILLAPKIAGATIIGLHPKATKLYGGRVAFLGAFFTELVLSVAYAPVLMIQQTRAVLRAAIGRPAIWQPQNRLNKRYPLGVLLRFHWLETLLGLILVAGLVSGLVSLWLIPIAASLILAVPLSSLSAVPVEHCLPGALRMNSPHSLREPHILKRAKSARSALRETIETQQIPAE